MMIVNFKEDKDLLPNIAIATTVLLDEDLFTFERFGNRIWIRTTFNSQFESVLALLDSGIEVVVINFSHLSGLTMTLIESGLENIPSNRLCLEFEPDMKNPGVGPNFKAMCPLFDNFIVKNPPIEVILTLQVSFPDNNFIVHSMEFLQNLEKGVKFMVDIEHLAIGPKNGKTNFVDLLLFNSKSDREDGLFATMVTDRQGVALGLCYSSKESIEKALETRTGVYFSRKRGLWYKGRTSGATQKLHTLTLDCDNDTLRFKVTQTNPGFCHLNTRTCFGQDDGITALVSLLEDRIKTAPEKSYTKRLFNDKDLLQSKILEEAEELCDATTKEDIAWETADLLYFAMVKCISAGVSLSEIENNLLTKSRKISRRPGNAKPPKDITESKQELEKVSDAKTLNMKVSDAKSCNMTVSDTKPFNMKVYDSKNLSKPEYEKLLLRPIINTKEIMERVKPIVQGVRERGDLAIKEFTKKFDNVDLDSIVLKHPYPEHLMKIDPKVKLSIDLAFANVEKFHIAQLDQPLVVETMPGVICSRFSRPIERVGLYVPGNYNGTEFRGTAVLPSSTLMLGVPAMVAGCKQIIIATPPTKDGSIVPEVVYVANKVGAQMIVKAGGAQAVAAMAYGTETVPKVDKICGPGNQYVTAAKMVAQSDSEALLSIDMPAGPSELLVIADDSAEPRYVVSDLLSQAEHGVDSQVVLLAVGFSFEKLQVYQKELFKQATALPRKDIVKVSLSKSYILSMDTLDEAMAFSNQYAPEHLILNIKEANTVLDKVMNAGSVFVGPYSPESCGDYASGTNHTLPTYGYARMYSGVNTGTFIKHITSQELTKEGLDAIGDAVLCLAEVEGLEAHRNAVDIRLKDIRK